MKENLQRKDKNQQQTQPTYDGKSRNRTRVTMVGGEYSHHRAIPVDHFFLLHQQYINNRALARSKIFSSADQKTAGSGYMQMSKALASQQTN